MLFPQALEDERDKIKAVRSEMHKIALGMILLPIAVFNASVSAACDSVVMSKTENGFIQKIVSGSNAIAAYTDVSAGTEAFKLDLMRPYFVICEDDGFFRISDVDALTVDEALAGNVGYVRMDQTFEWPTSEALSFSDMAFMSGRPDITAWDSIASLADFMKTGDDKAFPPSFRENIDATLKRERTSRPYPVLGSDFGMIRGTMKKRYYDVLLPAAIRPADSIVVNPEDMAKVAEALTSATIVIAFDATASMGSFANQVSSAISGALETLPVDLKDKIRIGFVFYRDSEDQEPLLQVQPMSLSDASKVLLQMSQTMSGGGDDAEPVLDAVYTAANLYDWPADSGRRLILAVLNIDAKTTTIGLDPDGKVPVGLDTVAVARSLFETNVPVMTVQAGPEKGPNLDLVLQSLADQTKGKYLQWGSGLTEAEVAIAVTNMLTDRTAAEIKDGENAVAAAFDLNGFAAIPLEVMDGEKLNRLREAGINFNIKMGDGGILVQQGYLLENSDLLISQIEISKETLMSLINLYSVLSVTGVDGDSLLQTASVAIAAIAGENFNPDDTLKEILQKQLGIQFPSDLLSFNLNFLDALTPAERLQFAKRIQDAATGLNQYLEAHLEAFDSQPKVWMPLSAFP